MKAALALIFFACVAGSMASDARSQFVDQLVQQGQAVAQSVLSQLQQQVLSLVQNALGQVTSLIGSFGRVDIINALLEQFKPALANVVNTVLIQVAGKLQGLFGGRASLNLGEIFNSFLQEIMTPIKELGGHFLNQGIASVLGGLSGSRGINDIWSALQNQVSGAVTVAQGVLNGALSNLSALGSNIIDASKPHWEQLQEQLVGHGLNVLGSISETVNNLHGSITGGR
jgi:hypothetical protein